MLNSIGWVYQIICASGSAYVGSTCDAKGVQTRWTRHKWELKTQQHSNSHLQRAWNKYGEGAFTFEILETTSKDLTLAREQYYIDTLNPSYNVCRVTGTTLGIKHPPRSQDTKDKISKAKKGKKLGPCSLETREKISAAQRGEKSHLWGKRGPESMNYGRARKKGFESKCGIPIKDQNGVVYGSQHEAARILGLNLSHINSVVRGKRKSTGGYKFTYA